MRATFGKSIHHIIRGSSAVAIGMALLHAGTASAQTGAANDRETATEASSEREIVVTGSRIERAGFDQPTPTTVLGAAELRAGARPSVAEILNDQPQFRSTVSPSISSGNTSTGTAPVDLRGLGTNRTLTLLNGRRFVGEGNLNFVPVSLLERVEVVTGGASAAWGSGAVAGVVNLLLKKDLQGLSLGAQAGVSSRGDGQRYTIDGSFGTSFADGRGHFMIGAEFVDDKGVLDRNSRSNLGSSGVVRVNPTSLTDQRTILVRDVNFGNVSRDGLIISGVLAGQNFNADGTLRPFRGGQQLGAAAFNGQMIGGEDGVGLYDSVGAITPFKRINGYARASYEIGAATVWVDASYGRTSVDTPFLPDYLVGPLTIQSSNPYLSQAVRNQLAAAGQTSFTLGRHFDDLFQLQFDVVRESKEGAIGIEGSFGGGNWKYRAHFSHGEIDSNQQLQNSRIANNFARAINAVTNSAGQIVCAVNADAITTNDDPACAPINPFGRGNVSAAAAAYVRGTQQQFSTNKLDSAGFQVQGDLFSLWAGPLTIAIGGEARWEEQVQSRGAQSQITPPIFGPLTVYSSDTSGGFNVKEGFAEAAVPLLDLDGALKLDLNGAARYSDYSNSGGIWSWKVGGTARLFNDFLLRATKSRDIRSPSIGELFAVRAINIGPLTDQDRAGRQGVLPGYNLNPLDVTTYTGGNPNLQPEIGKTLVLGGSYSPSYAPGLNLSVDYYKIKVEGFIASLSGSLLTLSCAQGNAESCSRIIRDATGTVRTVNTINQNIANLETRGIDFEASYVLPLDRLSDNMPGSIRIRALATHVERFVFNNGLTSVDTAGVVGNSAARAVPKWRGTFSLSYQDAVVGVDARVRYIDGGVFDNLATTLVNNTITSRTYVDLGLRFNVDKKFTLFGNVNNLFDRDPPITSTGAPIFETMGTYFTAGARVNF